jgi:hypothetical protein
VQKGQRLLVSRVWGGAGLVIVCQTFVVCSQMGAMMPLTMRPTGAHSPVYADRQDWTTLDDGKPVGRVYEDASASTRWFWSITVYVDPRAGICASGKGHDRAGWLHAVRVRRQHS